MWESVLGCGKGKGRCGAVGKCDRVWVSVGGGAGCVEKYVCWGVGDVLGEVLREVWEVLGEV